MVDLAEIERVEEQSRHGVASLGEALRMLIDRWRGGARDDGTVIRLLFLLWYGNVEPPILTGISTEGSGLTFEEVLDSVGGKDAASPLVQWAVGKMAELFPWAAGDENVWREASSTLLARATQRQPQIGASDFSRWGIAGDYFQHLAAVQTEHEGIWQLPFNYAVAQAKGFEGTEAEAYVRLGEGLVFRRKSDDALTALRHAVELDASNSLAWYRIGELHFRAMRYEEAVEAFAAATALVPNHWVSHHHLGKALAWLNRHAEAIDALTRAAELNPKAASIFVQRAQSKAALGRVDEAVNDLEMAIQLQPGAKRFQRMRDDLCQQRAHGSR